MKDSKLYDNREHHAPPKGARFAQVIERNGWVIATVSGDEKNLVEIIAKAAVAALNKAVGN